MKANINGIEVEGTPQEMSELLGRKQSEPKTEEPTQKKAYRKTKKKTYNKKNKSHQPWTSAERKELMSMYNTGVRVPKIAKHFNRSKAAIRTQVSWIRQGKISVGQTPTVKSGSGHHGQVWTSTEDQTLMKELRNGNTQKRIGALLGRTHESVKVRVKILRKKYDRTEKVKVGQDTYLPKKSSYYA